MSDPSQGPSPLTSDCPLADRRGPRPSSRLRPLLAFSLGALLFAAALYALFASRDALPAAWISARAAPAWMVLLALALPGANWLLSASMFLALTRRYGRVGGREMAALMGSAWLLNMLPARPGLAGRIAYHRAVNGISLVDSGKVLIQATSCTLAALALLVFIVVAAASRPGSWPMLLLIALALWSIALLASHLGFSKHRNSVPARVLRACALRFTDALVWSLRYWLLFSILGNPVSPEGAGAIAAASMAAGLLPVPIGLREWVVGLTAAALPPEFFPAATPAPPGVIAAAAPGLAADLVMRACELLWAIPVGLLCTAWLWRRWAALAPRPSPRSPGRGTG